MDATPEREALVLAVLKAAREHMQKAYEEAGCSGLCAEGRWEYALDSLHGIDIPKLLQEAGNQPSR